MDDTTEQTEAVQLLNQRLECEAPPSAAEQWDVALAVTELSPHRACALALGLSWPKLRRWLVKEGIRYKGDAPAFAGQVFDYLMSKGATYADITAAGRVALRACSTDLPGAALPKTDGERSELMGNSSGTED